MLENTLKNRMAEQATLHGIWLGSGSDGIAEALSHTGFDWMLIDAEHGPIETSGILPLLRAIAPSPTAAVVRLPWNDPVLIKRALDLGATTLMLPFIQNAEEAKAAVSAMRYAPEGIRGVAGVTRAARYGLDANYLHEAKNRLGLIVQVETAEAVGNISDIASVEGVDAVFIGPADLAASLGHLGDSNHPEVQDAIARAANAIRAAGKSAAILALEIETARKYRGFGFNMIAGGIDVHLLVKAASELRRKLD